MMRSQAPDQTPALAMMQQGMEARRRPWYRFEIDLSVGKVNLKDLIQEAEGGITRKKGKGKGKRKSAEISHSSAASDASSSGASGVNSSSHKSHRTPTKATSLAPSNKAPTPNHEGLNGAGAAAAPLEGPAGAEASRDVSSRASAMEGAGPGQLVPESGDSQQATGAVESTG
ncbi:unnamed protein product, partial [Discosporangium mesarthrocarpum]